MRKLLAVEEAAGLSGLPDTDPVALRKLNDDAQRALDSAVGRPEPVARVEDLKAHLTGREVPIRVYWSDLPRQGTGLPVVVYFHGGGWVVGSIAGSDATCREIANLARCAVVSVGYRLAPEHKFPAAVEDAVEVVRWLATEENAGPLSLDSERLVVAGDSAGGNLSAVVALDARDRGSPKLSGQVLICPVTDTDGHRPSYRENAHGFGFEVDFVPWMWEQYLRSPEDRVDRRLAVLRVSDLRGVAPAFVLTAQYDMLRDEGEEYAERLRAAGVPVTAHRYDGVVHNFIEYRTLESGGHSATAQGREAIREIADWVRGQFGSS